MKSIHTLIPDIYELIRNKELDDNFQQALSQEISLRISAKIRDEGKRGGLRLSKMGSLCPCALWYSAHRPELEEVLPPWAQIKYLYGHILEALVIALAKEAGHEVTGEQDELTLDGVTGHRDCVVDGCVVDVKSSVSHFMAKYKNRTIASSDNFGYLDQLDGYTVASLDDPLVRVKDKAYILAIDKTLGHMVLYEHKVREQHIRERIRTCKEIVGQAQPPACQCRTVADGKSGNVALAFPSTYNNFKHACYPNLRTFLYADGPVYLTKVVRVPDVPEVDRHGQRLYNFQGYNVARPDEETRN